MRQSSRGEKYRNKSFFHHIWNKANVSYQLKVPTTLGIHTNAINKSLHPTFSSGGARPWNSSWHSGDALLPNSSVKSLTMPGLEQTPGTALEYYFPDIETNATSKSLTLCCLKIRPAGELPGRSLRYSPSLSRIGCNNLQRVIYWDDVAQSVYIQPIARTLTRRRSH